MFDCFKDITCTFHHSLRRINGAIHTYTASYILSRTSCADTDIYLYHEKHLFYVRPHPERASKSSTIFRQLDWRAR